MKILKFYLTNGYIQAVDIETVVPAGNSYIDNFSHGVAIEDIVEKIVEVYETHSRF